MFTLPFIFFAHYLVIIRVEANKDLGQSNNINYDDEVVQVENKGGKNGRMNCNEMTEMSR